MIRIRVKEILTHPMFISLVIWAVVMLFIPPVFTRYRIKHLRDEYPYGKVLLLFDDIDSDGTSERISFDFNDQKQTKIIFGKGNKIIDQYDLKYQPSSRIPGYFADFNGDGFKELYVFTMNLDSLFLNIIDPLNSGTIVTFSRFIDKRRIAPNSTDTPQAILAGTLDKNAGKDKDIIFYITTGYSTQPRNVYRYSVSTDSLIKSPESGVVIRDCILHDVNGDSFDEILLDVAATGNLDESFKYSDMYSWLMVLDMNLNFLFPPVKLGGNPSGAQVLPFAKNEKKAILVFFDNYGDDTLSSSLSLYDPDGTLKTRKPVYESEPTIARIFPGKAKNGRTFYFLQDHTGKILEMDSSFNVLRASKIPMVTSGNPFFTADADMDGRTEYVFHGYDKQTLIFVRDDFSQSAEWRYSDETLAPIISQVFVKGQKPYLYLQFTDKGRYIRYEKNPYTHLRYPFFAGIYLTIWLFILTIARIQQYRIKLIRDNEIRMASLQVKAIKNQIDPHFTLNVLNAIGSLYSDEKTREKADYIFGKYARLIRQTVISSDEVIITFSDELDFVRNYVEIERFRSNNAFEYSITSDEETNMKTKIPRMLIHTFVENSIKYGIRRRDEGGLLDIAVQTSGNSICISVEDNGPGLSDHDGSPENGTGRGLHILNELIGLYYKLENVRITYKLENKTSGTNAGSGTRALINIPVKAPR